MLSTLIAGMTKLVDLWFLCTQMTDTAPPPAKYVPKIPGKLGAEEDLAPIHKIRITLTSRNVKNLEKGKHPDPT